LISKCERTRLNNTILFMWKTSTPSVSSSLDIKNNNSSWFNFHFPSFTSCDFSWENFFLFLLSLVHRDSDLGKETVFEEEKGSTSLVCPHLSVYFLIGRDVLVVDDASLVWGKENRDLMDPMETAASLLKKKILITRSMKRYARLFVPDPVSCHGGREHVWDTNHSSRTRHRLCPSVSCGQLLFDPKKS